MNSDKIKQLLKRTTERRACCREARLLELAENLRQSGEDDTAKDLESAVDDIMKQRHSIDEPASKYIKGAPKGVDKYYLSAMDKYKDREKATRIALAIYCQHVKPNCQICAKLGK